MYHLSRIFLRDVVIGSMLASLQMSMTHDILNHILMIVISERVDDYHHNNT